MTLQKRPSLRSLGEISLLALLGLPGAVAAAGLSGADHRWPDLLAQFVAPAAAPTLLILACALALRFRAAAAGAILVLAALAAAARPQWFPPPGEPKPDAPVVSVYSANLWSGNRDVDAVARSIGEADADIVILVELGDAPAARLDEILKGYPSRVATARVEGAGGPARSVIAARHPLRALPERTDDGLAAVAAVAETPLGPIGLMGVHLTRPWPFQYQWGQISQATAMAAIRRDLPPQTIVAGDFNSVSSARIGRQIQAETDLTPAPGYPGTWPARLPASLGMTIDQVWRSPRLALLERRLGRRNGSDHRPVITRFTSAEP